MRAFFALALLLAASTRGEATYYPAASILAPALSLSASPRSLSMGEAATALEEDAFSIDGNPAGLARLSGDLEMGLLYGQLYGDQGPAQNYGVAASRVDMGVLAISGSYMPFGSFELRDADGEPNGYASAWDSRLSLAWANTFFDDRLSFGLVASANYEYIWGWRLWADGGLGAGWRVNDRLNIALSATRINAGFVGVYPATALAIGSAFSSADKSLKLLTDFNYPLHDYPSLRGGLEWKPVSYLALRGGWRQMLGAPAGELQQGPTAGLGILAKGMGLDYAFGSYGPFNTHRVALTVKIPERWIRKPRVVIQADGGTMAAKAFYELGLSQLGSGKKLDALVSFKQCLQADPGFEGAQAKIDSISKDVEGQQKSGARSREVEAMINRYVEQGIKHFKGGEFKKAIQSFEIALEVDKKNAEILKQIQMAREQLEGKVIVHMESGAALLEQGKLGAAVAEFYEALKLDPDHQGAKARLASLAPKIKAEIKRLHRQGIDAYLDDQLDKAIEIWKGALALDPSDPDSVKRDLVKATKLKELRK